MPSFTDQASQLALAEEVCVNSNLRREEGGGRERRRRRWRRRRKRRRKRRTTTTWEDKGGRWQKCSTLD